MQTARLMVLDVETIPTGNKKIEKCIREEAWNKEVAKNKSKELKAEWNTETACRERAEKAFRDTAKQPLHAQICTVCGLALPVSAIPEIGAQVVVHNKENTLKCYQTKTGMEFAMLEFVAEWLNERATQNSVWIGHNIGFDLGCLLNSWRRLQITPPKHFPRYIRSSWRGRTFDTMNSTPTGTFKDLIKLDELAELHGINAKSLEYKKQKMDGSLVYEAFLDGQYEFLQSYCWQDVETALQLYLVQTSGDQWGTYQATESAGEQIRAIKEAFKAGTLTETQMRCSVFAIMEKAGLLPA